MRISDWSSDVCSSDLAQHALVAHRDNVLAGVGEFREQGAQAVLHVARAFAAGRPEVEAAGFVGCHAGPQIGAQLRQGAAFPGAPVGLDEPRLRLYRAAAQNCRGIARSEEHTSELQSLMRISYAVFCLQKKKHTTKIQN